MVAYFISFVVIVMVHKAELYICFCTAQTPSLKTSARHSGMLGFSTPFNKQLIVSLFFLMNNFIKLKITVSHMQLHKGGFALDPPSAM